MLLVCVVAVGTGVVGACCCCSYWCCVDSGACDKGCALQLMLLGLKVYSFSFKVLKLIFKYKTLIVLTPVWT